MTGRLAEALRAFRLQWSGMARPPLRSQGSPRPKRLPPQPWEVEAKPSDNVVYTAPVGPNRTPIVPTAYGASGPIDWAWPYDEGIVIHPVKVRYADDVTLIKRNVILGSDGKLLSVNVDGSRMKDGVKRSALEGRYELSDRGAPTRISGHIDEPVFLVDCCWHFYGHLLLELMPMLLLRHHVPPEARVMTSAPLSRTLLRMFEQLGVSPDRVSQIEEPVTCARVYWVDPAVRIGWSFHPMAWDAFAQLRPLANQSSIERHERIFVSRSAFKDRRPLNIEAEVEGLFRSYGFAIVQPENLEIEDQIALFSGARMIAGLGGSGMHNTVFADPDIPVLVLQTKDMITKIDISLSEASRPLGYVFGESRPNKNPFIDPWVIDPRAVETGLKLHFGL